MLNIGAGEIIIIGLVLLIVVGPEQLPGVIRRVGRTVSEARAMTENLRSEFMSGMEEIEKATDPNAWAASAGPSDDSPPIKAPKPFEPVTAADADAEADDDADDESADDTDSDSDAEGSTEDSGTDNADTDNADTDTDGGGDAGGEDSAGDRVAAATTPADDEATPDRTAPPDSDTGPAEQVQRDDEAPLVRSVHDNGSPDPATSNGTADEAVGGDEADPAREGSA